MKTGLDFNLEGTQTGRVSYTIKHESAKPSSFQSLDPVRDAVERAVENNTFAAQLASLSLSIPIYACIELEKMLKESAESRGVVRAMLERTDV